MRLIDADAFERDLKLRLLPVLVDKYGAEEALNGLHFSYKDYIRNLRVAKEIRIVNCEECFYMEKYKKGSATLYQCTRTGDQTILSNYCGFGVSMKHEKDFREQMPWMFEEG